MAVFTSDTNNHFFSTCKYNNELELLSIVITLYSIAVLGEALTGNLERVALRFYLQGGYNEISKKAIMIELGMKGDKGKKHLDQINWKLTKKGFLQKHETNFRLKTVNKDLENLKNSFLKQKKEYYTIRFAKNA